MNRGELETLAVYCCQQTIKKKLSIKLCRWMLHFLQNSRGHFFAKRCIEPFSIFEKKNTLELFSISLPIVYRPGICNEHRIAILSQWSIVKMEILESGNLNALIGFRLMPERGVRRQKLLGKFLPTLCATRSSIALTHSDITCILR